jgi:CheY-like chemotaxis protein
MTPAPPPSAPTRGAPPPAGALRCEAVLLVEDSRPLQTAMRACLEGAGYRVLSADSGAAALDLLAAFAPRCLVLLDLMMPGMSGWELLSRLRQTPKLSAHPVVLVSAARRPQAEGASRFLAKPFSPEQLRALVAEFCAPARSET